MALQAVWSLCRVLPRLWLSVCSSVVDTSITAPKRASTSFSTLRRPVGRHSVGAAGELAEAVWVTGAALKAGSAELAVRAARGPVGRGGGASRRRRGPGLPEEAVLGGWLYEPPAGLWEAVAGPPKGGGRWGCSPQLRLA